MNLDGHNAYIAASYIAFFVTMFAIVLSTVWRGKAIQKDLEILKMQLDEND